MIYPFHKLLEFEYLLSVDVPPVRQFGQWYNANVRHIKRYKRTRK